MLMLNLMAAPEGGTANPAATMMMMFGFIAIFYFIFFRPQRKQQKEHQEMVKNLKRGDKVSTIGGIVGEIVHITNDIVTIKSGDTRVEVERSKIGKVN
ncbi:MAG: preprotein translocase subunit YajC [Gemmatimonadales bacterium]|nr:preprotein translocase subunit YajC [Gemmatimonadales bacterium]MYG18932.1 preprotein translocase subunit YajC [Gemmatimonadales bacterium]MYH09348.1 preprotein translocase subunit YajC [Gemmatimonadales bacterium]MYL07428.1 preprotein translocase subunit YajC [Gemmatimonadales bacterium]